jgi:hypothetical protein
MELHKEQGQDTTGSSAVHSQQDAKASIKEHLLERFYQGCTTAIRINIQNDTFVLSAISGNEMPSKEHEKTLIEFAKLYLQEIGYTKKSMPKLEVKFGDDDGYFMLRYGRSTSKFFKVA